MSYPLACIFQNETDNAICILDVATGEELWIPLSQVDEIHGNKVRGKEIEVVMTDWIAKKKGLL